MFSYNLDTSLILLNELTEKFSTPYYIQLLSGDAFNEIPEQINILRQHISNLLYQELEEYFTSAGQNTTWNKRDACEMLDVHLSLIDYMAQKKKLTDLLDGQLDRYFSNSPSSPRTEWNKNSSCKLLKDNTKLIFGVNPRLPVGTKVRWECDKNNYATCIQMPYGLLEVYYKNNGMTLTVKKSKLYAKTDPSSPPKKYKDFNVWLSSAAPCGGKITIEYPDNPGVRVEAPSECQPCQ
jgi:hypothetical protein